VAFCAVPALAAFQPAAAMRLRAHRRIAAHHAEVRQWMGLERITCAWLRHGAWPGRLPHGASNVIRICFKGLPAMCLPLRRAGEGPGVHVSWCSHENIGFPAQARSLP
jgi:hypothetical protein